MAAVQSRITDLPLSREAAAELAEETLISDIGTTPNLGQVRESAERFIFDVDVSYPRVIWDDAADEPRKTRFLRVGKVGEITVDRVRGRVLERPKYYIVQAAIRERIQVISDTVEKGLVKVAADEFAQLPFPVHLHTPVLDVLSWLLIRDKLTIKDLQEIPSAPAARITSTLDPLRRVGLIEILDDVVLPGPLLIGIEQEYEALPLQLSKALALFFREGYEFLDTVRQVLGAHLRVSGMIYERATEYEDPFPLSIAQIEKDFVRFYPQERLVKLPRYLVQLEAIGLIQRTTKHGTNLWAANPGIYGRMASDPVMAPIEPYFASPSPFAL
jgi:hypothetical protein